MPSKYTSGKYAIAECDRCGQRYDLKKLKQYADAVKDRVESMKEITRVDIIGALDREIQVNLDEVKVQEKEARALLARHSKK